MHETHVAGQEESGCVDICQKFLCTLHRPNQDNREDMESRTAGIFIPDTPYDSINYDSSSLNHNENMPYPV